MKRAIFYTTDIAGSQTSWGGPFVEGLRHHGWDASISNRIEACDLFVLWGARRAELIARVKKLGAEVVVLERAYVADRFKWVSVSFGGGLNGRGKFHGPFQDGSRWRKHFADQMQPWREHSNGYALIMEQIVTDTAVRNVDLPAFYRRAHDAFMSAGRAVRQRPHPHVTPQKGDAAIAAARQSLHEDLQGAVCAVTWNSNSAVDAVLAGVPAIAMDVGSMAWDVTGHELALPPKPDRTAWANALAWKQWTREELASGYCWDMIARRDAVPVQ